MTANNETDVIAGLEQAKQDAPELADLLDFHRELLVAAQRTTAQMPPSTETPTLTTDEARGALGRGSPLIRTTGLALEWHTFYALYGQICDTVGMARPDLAPQCQHLQALLDSDPAKLRTLVTGYIQKGVPTALDREAELLSFVINHALRPALTAYAQAVAGALADTPWHGGECPICGGEPDFAFLDADAGARHLVCSRCDSQWLFPRVKCPFCATAKPADLQFYPTEEKQYRLYVCKVCRRYLKTLDLRKAVRSPLMPAVERVLTVDLDVAARVEGYR